MPTPNFNIDFEGNGGNGSSSTPNPNGNNGTTPNNQPDVTNLGGGDTPDITGQNNQPNGDNGNGGASQQGQGDGNGGQSDHSSTGELEPGTNLEIDGANYTVDKDGNIVNDKGEIFKKKEDVSAWLKEVNVEGDDNQAELNIDNVQKALGETIVDAQGNPVEFTNDVEGVKAYVQSVIDLKAVALQEAAINKLYADNPLLKQFQDYVAVNGSPKGFGDLPDRSGITLDKENENQLISVIQMAAKEFNNPTIDNNYIQYLKDSGALYDAAKTQLKALIDRDNQIRTEIETRAKQQADEQKAATEQYWQSVNKVIAGRVINGFKLPESFTKDVDGKKLTFTPNDFYNYLSKATAKDANGNPITAYQRDFNAISDEEMMNKDILDAWLLFTGGSYKDLINMAVNEEKVRQLRITSEKRNNSKTVKVVTNRSGKTDINSIILQ